MSDNRYRSSGTGSRWDSDRSPNYSIDSHSDGRSSTFRRDSDRGSDHATDRVRPSRSTPREVGPFRESRRSVSDLYTPSANANTNANANASLNMDSQVAEKATSNIAKQLILLHEAQADWVQTKTKKDLVSEGLRQRLATYDRHGGRNALEPSVAEAWQKQHDHLKQEEDKFNKELAKIDARIKTSAHEYARLLVKELPISEIKERHLVDAAKSELARERKSAPAPTPAPASAPVAPSTNDSNRIQKLERQMSSLLKAQETQQVNYAKLMKENEEHRLRIALYETQATEVAALKVQLEQVLQNQQQQQLLQQQQQQQQQQFSNEGRWVDEIETLKLENTALKSQVSESQTKISGFVKQIELQQAELSKSLQEAISQPKQSATISSGLTDQVEALKALQSQVKEHDKVLSNFDAEEYAAAVSKLINYPDYSELEKTMVGYGSELQRTSLATQEMSQRSTILSSDVSKITKRLITSESRIDVGFKEFSDQVIETCGKVVQDLKDRIEHLSIQFSSESRAAGELQQLREANSSIENALKAHEMMIMGLDEQFKNMSTLDQANIIFDHLKRLLPTLVPLDIQNFHERLVDLEAFRQEQARRGKHFDETWGADLQRLVHTKRSQAEGDDGLEQP